MKLTDRDKRLLVLVSMILIAALFWKIGFEPLQTSIDDLTESRENLEMTKQEMEMKIAQKPAMEEGIETGKQQCRELFDQYYDTLQNQEVDRVFTSLAIEHGLESLYLQVTMPSGPLKVGKYLYSAADIEDGEDMSSFSAPTIQMKLRGTEKQLQSFIDDISENQKAIQISSVVFLDEGNEEAASKDDSFHDISISMLIYMCDKPEL